MHGGAPGLPGVPPLAFRPVSHQPLQKERRFHAEDAENGCRICNNSGSHRVNRVNRGGTLLTLLTLCENWFFSRIWDGDRHLLASPREAFFALADSDRAPDGGRLTRRCEVRSSSVLSVPSAWAPIRWPDA
jgi:hypothetical protein